LSTELQFKRWSAENGKGTSMIIDKSQGPAIAACRFGFGARPGELEAARTDPRGWLLAQLRTPYQAPTELNGLSSGREILATYLAARAARAAERKAAAREADSEEAVKQLTTRVREQLLPHYQAQAAARTRIALASENSFRERLVHFWSNHFAVSVDKQICLGTAGALENEAIRPRIDSRFADLLVAVESHPAMITYLDNQRSVGPNSTLGARAARRADTPAAGKIGLNENLAREILELHTLGVDGGYSQNDVTTFAAVITGWSIGGGEGRYADGEPGAFVFRSALHEPGSKTILGRHYADGDMAQGEAVLRDLAAHPATARHIATKLARHFVADDPPAELVERLVRAYHSNDGHLPSVYTALISWDGAWQSERLKYKQPHEFIYSSLRALDVTPREPKALLGPFEVLGQRHWSPGSPAGWPDRQADWDGADALMQRIEWSVALADRVGDSRSAPATADAALGGLTTSHTRQALANAASGSQGLALLLLSPEFQRR
jgi:uncharacterized protein (DUF1800 family)